ncbi:CNNM domain-containing protein [Thalassotalea agarivorans]|uniref:Hemolysin, contains CBS domains n=1 Tax=Thalassotalea agarivorans TaxID=349064 RepID=A0A1I0GM89_THASX|nr:hemolysin family protein [Thalassotalea agarivorans]SET72324.1 Hemolysin, contains CBS domains [Thalassotalea agarivorans]
MTLLIFYLCIAIGVSFLCSILEAVLLSVTPSFVEQKVQESPRAAKLLVKIKNNLDQSISSILILNTFAHTMGAAGVGAQAISVFGPEKETLVAFVLTLAILYLSEIIPKTLGARYWRQLALPSAYLINVLVKLVFPLVWLSSKITRLFNSKQGDVISREEVLALAALSHKAGAIAYNESILVENILNLRAAKTDDILTPRTVVHALNKSVSVSEALEQESTANFTRIPVYDGTIDKVVGFIHKSALYEQDRQGHGDQAIEQYTKPLKRVSENLPVLALLDLFIKRKAHIFLVEDEYGQTAGIVTLEDAIETLLGREIVDESDQVEDMQALAKKNYRARVRSNPKITVSDTDSDE